VKHALGLLAAVVVPLVMFETSAGYYAARSVLAVRMQEMGVAISDISWTYGTTTLAMAAGMLASAALSAATGPAPAAGLGLLLAALGQGVAFAAPDAPTLKLGLILGAVGWGLHRPAALASIARWLTGLDGPRAAALIAAYALVNIAGAASSLVIPAMELAGSAFPSIIAAGGDLVGAVAMLGLFGASFVLAPPEDEGSSERFDGRAVAIAVVASVLGSVVASTWYFGEGVVSNAVFSSPTPPSASWMLVNPAVVVALSGFFAVAALVTQLIGLRPPLFLVAGLGAWAWAAALGAAAVMPGDPRVTDVIGAFGEVLFYGGMFAAVTRGVHYRLLAVPIAVMTAAPYGASILSNAVAATGLSVTTPLIGAAALLCVPLGAALVVLSVVLERPVPTNPDDPAA
jgi:hypothetical protein